MSLESQSMATLGQELREERERRAVSLKEISDQTKISGRLLLASRTTAGRRCLRNYFLKGLIKSYCRAIDADPGTYLAKYNEQRGLRAEAPEQKKTKPLRSPGRAKKSKRRVSPLRPSVFAFPPGDPGSF